MGKGFVILKNSGSATFVLLVYLDEFVLNGLFLVDQLFHCIAAEEKTTNILSPWYLKNKQKR